MKKIALIIVGIVLVGCGSTSSCSKYEYYSPHGYQNGGPNGAGGPRTVFKS